MQVMIASPRATEMNKQNIADKPLAVSAFLSHSQHSVHFPATTINLGIYASQY